MNFFFFPIAASRAATDPQPRRNIIRWTRGTRTVNVNNPGGPTKPLTQQGGDPALKPIKWKPSGTRYKKTTLWLIGPSSVPVIKGVSTVINVESSAFALSLRV